ncbi:MAG: ParB/RepB/Spo0J family partition protein [Elusimicrobiota bacterium]
MSASGQVMEIPVDEIDVSELNVRKTEITEGIDALADNINRYGLLQPIVVLKKEDTYELIVGQRRYLAVKKLGWEKITATVLGDVDPITSTIMSLSENIHRRELPYRDMVDACDILYDRYNDTGIIAKELGVHESTVQRYLSHRLVPEPIKEMVEKKEISRDDALRVSTATMDSIIEGDMEKPLNVAKEVAKMSKPEKNRTLKEIEENPEQEVHKAIKKASKPPKKFKITIELANEYQDRLEAASKALDLNVSEVVKQAVMQWLKAMNY